MDNLNNEYVQESVAAHMRAFARIMDEALFSTSKYIEKHVAWCEFCSLTRRFKFMGKGEAQWISLSCGMDSRAHVAHWMEHNTSSVSHYAALSESLIITAANVIAAKLALPVAYSGTADAPHHSWFSNEVRAHALAQGFLAGCKKVHVAHVGQSPSLGYRPSDGTPFFSGSITGVVWPNTRPFMQESIRIDPDARILGIPSQGIDGHGVPFLMQRGLMLADGFLTHVPGEKKLSTRTLGEEILAPARSIVGFIEEFIPHSLDVHAILPVRDNGVATLLDFEERIPLTYYIENWPAPLPPIFYFLQDELGIHISELLMNVNYGIGCFILAPQRSVKSILALGKKIHLPIYELGYVLQGERKVVFRPENNLVISAAT